MREEEKAVSNGQVQSRRTLILICIVSLLLVASIDDDVTSR